ncbi:MAG: AbgT family transporter [Dermatophilus congolensis]|nr:AbgT family transporter [Dermatophilus congolensis]
MSTATDTQRTRILDRFLNGVEWAGNKLPDPIALFASICVLIVLASSGAAAAGWSVVHPATGETVNAVSLLDPDNLRRIISEGTKNFGAFPALGLVLVVMLGIGLAEKSGWFEVLMRNAMVKAPKRMIIPAIGFIGVMGNVAGDAAPIVLPPIAALIFVQLGWHPLAGIALAYASALGGFAANLILGMSDALVFAFTEPAAALVDPNVQVNTAMNYYFIAASVPVLVLAVWLVTSKVTIPRLGVFSNPEFVHEDVGEITPEQRSALKWANWSVVVVTLAIVAMSVPANGLMRNGETGSLLNDSPLMNGIAILLAVFFFVPGFIYGVKTGSIKNTRDAGVMMTESMAGMGNFIVIVFFASQMLAYFSWSNLGTIIAVEGATALKGQNGVVLIVGILVLSSLVNLLIGSASAKWAILAPIFVPMMMLLDFHPAFTQMVYRVGDSITNPITPMLPYFPLVLALAQKYDKKMGMGTLISAMLPYTIVIGVFWTLFLIVWFLLGWPVGPGGPIYL